MDIRQLRHFICVAEHASFTRAARELGVAQPAVSNTIKKLEADLGLNLLHRQDKRVQLTVEGKTLIPYAKEVLSKIGEAEVAMQRLKKLNQGEVRIALPCMIGSYYFPALLMAFHHIYPDLKLSLIEAGACEIEQMLAREEVDIGIIIEPGDKHTLETIPLTKEEIVAAVGLEHPLAQNKAVSFAELLQHELVTFKPGYYHREQINQIGLTLGIKPNIVFETNLIELIRSIVRQGFATTTVLKIAVEQDPQILALPLDEPMYMDIHIGWKRGRTLTQADRTFLDFMLTQKSA